MLGYAKPSSMLLCNHAFIKKFEGKDIDIRILVESLELPRNVPRERSSLGRRHVFFLNLSFSSYAMMSDLPMCD